MGGAKPTGVEGDLADEQPAVGEGKLAAQDLCGAPPQGQGDGPGRGVLQVLQGHGQDQRWGPGLQQARLELALHTAEDPHALRVTIVTMHLEGGGGGGGGGGGWVGTE